MPYLKFDLPEYPYREDMWDAIAKETRPIVVYGMGNGADKLVRRLLRYGVEVADYFASDGFVRGHSFHGKRVKSFSEIRSEYPDFVILLSFASSREEVLEVLNDIDSRYDMYVPDMPVADEEEYFDREFYNLNYGEIKKAYNRLDDENSRSLFAAVVRYKLTGRMSYLERAWSDNADIYSLMPCNSVITAVDAGAYNGDTAREMKAYFTNLKKIYAIEPDKKNFKKLNRYKEAESDLDIVAINAATWCDDGFGVFSESGNRNSTISATASHEHNERTVELVRIDSVSESVDYIKYDVEGAELEALMGSHLTLQQSASAALVSVYHRSRDIFSIVNYFADKYPDYSLYLRRTRCTPAWEISLIAVRRR